MNDRFTPLDRLFQDTGRRKRFDDDDLPEDELDGFEEVDLDEWEKSEEELFSGTWKDEIGYDPRTARDDDWN